MKYDFTWVILFSQLVFAISVVIGVTASLRPKSHEGLILAALAAFFGLPAYVLAGITFIYGLTAVTMDMVAVTEATLAQGYSVVLIFLSVFIAERGLVAIGRAEARANAMASRRESDMSGS